MESEVCDGVTSQVIKTEDLEESQFDADADISTSQPITAEVCEPEQVANSCSHPLMLEEGGEGEVAVSGHYGPHDYVAVSGAETGGDGGDDAMVDDASCVNQGDSSELVGKCSRTFWDHCICNIPKPISRLPELERDHRLVEVYCRLSHREAAAKQTHASCSRCFIGLQKSLSSKMY